MAGAGSKIFQGRDCRRQGSDGYLIEKCVSAFIRYGPEADIEKRDELAPSHCLLRASRQGIVAAQTRTGKGPAHSPHARATRKSLSAANSAGHHCGGDSPSSRSSPKTVLSRCALRAVGYYADPSMASASTASVHVALPWRVQDARGQKRTHAAQQKSRYSITSSALATKNGGIVRLNGFLGFRLTTK